MKRLLALTVSALAITTTAQAADNWDMPMAYPANNYHTENAQAFVDAVDACTGGELKITIHAGGSLFKGGEIKRAVQIGEAQIGERLLSAHANDLLYSVPWPPQGLYFAQEVNSTADVSGTKFRAYNAATARVAELAGMIPAQIEAAELKQALATGVVSSFISSGSTGVDEKVWEDLTHFYDAKAWLPRNSIFVNSDAYNALPEASQKCLMDEAKNAETVGTNTAEELAGGFLKTLADNGLNVAEPGDTLAGELSAIGETMTGEWLASAGDDGAAIVDAFKN